MVDAANFFTAWWTDVLLMSSWDRVRQKAESRLVPTRHCMKCMMHDGQLGQIGSDNADYHHQECKHRIWGWATLHPELDLYLQVMD